MAYNFAKLGSQLGSGIGEGLQQLAQNKLNKKLRQQEEERAAEVFIRAGLDREDALAIAKQPAEFQRMAFQKLEGLQFGGRPQQQQQQIQPQPMAQEQANPMQSMSGLGEPQIQQPTQQPVAAPKVMSQSPVASPLVEEPMNKVEKVSEIEQESAPKMVGKIFKIGKPTGEAAAKKQEQALEHKDQAAINKEVHPYVVSVQDKAKAAKENNLRLARMEKLIDNGKLNNPTFASILQTLKNGTGGSLLFGHIGVDLENLLSADSQEFNKLSQDFVKNAKEIFGSRLTDTDLKTFMRTVPTLSQSDAGKRAVIKNLKLMNEADEVRNKAARELLKEYGSNLPLDFQSEVEDRAKQELDKIAEKFNENTEKKTKKKGIFGGIFPNTGLFPPEE